jgi:hypothetical protein
MPCGEQKTLVASLPLGENRFLPYLKTYEGFSPKGIGENPITPSEKGFI